MDSLMTKGTIIVITTFKAGYERYFDEYSQRVKQLLSRYSTTVIRRQAITETLFGAEKRGIVMLIDFEDINIARKIFFEEEYNSIIPLRDKVFEHFEMHVADWGNV